MKLIIYKDNNIEFKSDVLFQPIHKAFADTTIICTTNKDELFSVVSPEDTDIILLEMIAPESDAIQICQQIKRDKFLNEIPVVFIISDTTDKASLNIAIESGAESFLLTPYDETILISQIRLMIHLKKTNRELKLANERLDLAEKHQLTDFIKPGHEKVEILSMDQPTPIPSENIINDTIQFEDLFNLDEIQQIQDEFANATNIASLITKPDGTPITRPSNFCRYCKIIRETEKGALYCLKSDQVIGQKVTSGIHIHTCLSGGLLDASASITIGNKKIANWLIGQVRSEKLNYDHISAYADEIGVDKEEFVTAYNSVPIMTEEQFGKIVKAHFIIAKQLSDKAFQNIQQAHIIDDNRKISGKLKQTMQSYLDVFNSVSEAIFIQEPETGIIIDVNKGAEKTYGYEREEFLGKTPFNLAAPGLNDLEGLLFKARDAFKSGLTSQSEFWAVRKNGEIFPKEIILNKGRYFGKDVMIATSRDITRQKETDDLIKKDRAELSSIVNAGNIFIIKTDLKGNYTYYNRYFKQEFGWIFEGDVISGQSAFNSIIQDDHEKTMDVVFKCIQNPNKTFQIELRKPNFNGDSFTTLWEFMCLTDLHGKPLEILCIGFDITAQKKAENDLRKSEEKYRALVDNAFEGIIIIDLNGTVLFANQSLIKTFEYESLEDVIGKNVFEFIAPESIPQAIEDLTQVVLGVDLDVAHYSGITSKGNKIRFESIGKLIDYEGIQADLISVRDTTAKMQAENALRESEEKYRMIAENMSDIVWTSDLNFNTTYMSPSGAKMYGAPFNEYAGWPLEKKIAPESIKKLKQLLAEELETEKDPDCDKTRSRIIEAEHYRADGSSIWLSLHVSFQRDSEGNVLGIHGVTRDINDQRKAEEALRVSEEKYRLIAENTSDGILILNARRQSQYTSPAYLKQLGYSAEESPVFNTETMYKNIHPDDRDELFKNIYEAITQKKSGLTYSYRAKHRGGYHIWLEDNARFMYDEHGNHTRTYIICRDITQRKITEEKLIENENKFRAITQTANDAILVTNSDGLIIFCNPKALEIFGYEENKFLNQPFAHIMPDRYRFDHHNSYNAFINEKVGHVMGKTREYFALRSDGTEFPMEISLSNWETSSGVFVSANIRDITERKRNEKIRKVQHRITAAALETHDLTELMSTIQLQLNTIIDATNFYVAIYNDKTGMLTAPFVSDVKDKENVWPADKSLTGLVIKKNKAMLLKRSDIEELYKSGEVILIGKESACWLGVPLHTDSKTTGAFVIQSYNNENAYNENDLEILEFISHQISMAILRKKDEQLISLLGKSTEQSPVSIIITNRQGDIEYVNPKFCKVTGYTFEEAIGNNPRILNSGHQKTEVYDDLWDKLNSGNQWFGELHNRRKNGELFWENISISPLTNQAGEITHFVAVKEDITEKKALFEELVITKEKAQESDQLKTAFLNNISHEIRTPFNGILGFLSLINEKDITTEEREQYIDIINMSAERLLNTINDIVEISTIQAHQTKVVKAISYISNLTERLFEKHKTEAEKKGLKLILNHQFLNHDGCFYTDEGKLFSVLTNLLNNAIKFTKSGSVVFGYEKSGDNVRFYVKDTGVGIQSHKKQTIFERFMQGDVSNTREFEGSGLGLSIAKAYVELLEGTIWLESEPGKGTVFYVEIPFQAVIFKKANNLTGISSPSNDDQQKPVILFAEDDDINFDFTNVLLRMANYTVIRAHTGAEAIRFCRNHPEISLILMDIKMPDTNGYVATSEIRIFNPDVPIIAVTAYSQPGDEKRALEAGCNSMLTKPVSRHTLLNTVNSFLRK